jgi:hypothetical protein
LKAISSCMVGVQVQRGRSLRGFSTHPTHCNPTSVTLKHATSTCVHECARSHVRVCVCVCVCVRARSGVDMYTYSSADNSAHACGEICVGEGEREGLGLLKAHQNQAGQSSETWG